MIFFFCWGGWWKRVNEFIKKKRKESNWRNWGFVFTGVWEFMWILFLYRQCGDCFSPYILMQNQWGEGNYPTFLRARLCAQSSAPPKLSLNFIFWIKFNYKISYKLRLQFLLNKINIIIYFKNLTIELHILYILNIHVKFSVNRILFIIWVISLYFMHKYKLQKLII